MRTYPPIISKDEAGIAVEFPNLPGCFSCGKSEEKTVARAKEALEGFLYVSERNGDPIVFPTHVGMNRIRAQGSPTPSGVPHARGDEPSRELARLYHGVCSPRTWG